MRIRKNLKYFLVSMAISSIFLIFISGLIITEYNIHNLVSDGSESFFSCNNKVIKLTFMGQIIDIDFNYFFDLVSSSMKKIYLNISRIK